MMMVMVMVMMMMMMMEYDMFFFLRRYEINTANAVLFNDLPLTGIPELLPGRLFTTRMPRNLNQGSAAGDAFMEKIKLNNLNTVMILAETKEYEKYAHADLEAFYKSCGLEILHKPFADYSVPNHEDIVQDVKDLTWRLAEGTGRPPAAQHAPELRSCRRARRAIGAGVTRVFTVRRPSSSSGLDDRHLSRGGLW